MIQLKHTRRDFAGSFAKGTLVWYLARSIQPAHAQAAKKLKRFVVFYCPEGANPQNLSGGKYTLTSSWCPKGTGKEHPIDGLSPILSSFTNIKSDTLVVDGLSNEGFARSGQSGNHFYGLGTVMTGSRAPGDKRDSLDQILAPVLKGNNNHLRTSVHLGVGTGGGACRKQGQNIGCLGNPQDAFNRLFADANVGAVKPQGLGEGEKGKRVIDQYLSEYKKLHEMVGQDEQHRLDQNVESLVEMQKRIAAEGNAPVGASCDIAALKARKSQFITGGSYDKVAPQMVDILANAFACDLTRVASLEISRPYGASVYYPWLGVKESHHGLAHSTATATRLTALNKVYGWYFSQVAALAEKLKAIPDPDGGSMLDWTVIITVSEFADGHHRANYMPTTLVGGSRAGLRGGRVLHFGSTSGEGATVGAAQPMNRLFLNIANDLAGMNLPTIGEPSYCVAGKLPGVT